MAEAMLSFTWASGDQLVASFDNEATFPDACAEAESSCRRLFAHGMAEVAHLEAADELPPLPDTE